MKNTVTILGAGLAVMAGLYLMQSAPGCGTDLAEHPEVAWRDLVADSGASGVHNTGAFVLAKGECPARIADGEVWDCPSKFVVFGARPEPSFDLAEATDRGGFAALAVDSHSRFLEQMRYLITVRVDTAQADQLRTGSLLDCAMSP